MADTQAPTRAARESRARDTRGEILAVASELFTDKGYDATSLREIAERLGITKAALYYHFPSKEDILRALLEPIGAIVGELLERLERSRNVNDWADTLSWLIDAFGANI
ncbi:MAG TPA: helix-turn-helix domain-containing protein, partial [Acidimicrobiia bacterium]